MLGDRNVASSRCRGWKIGEELMRRGYDVHFNERSLDCDCLIVQKCGGYFDLLKNHPNSIYDFDDFYHYKISFEAIRIAKKVTVGAVSLKKYCSRATYIPDCLDKDSDVEKQDYNKTGKLIWFGNPNNCRVLEKYLAAFRDWELVIITDYEHHLYRFHGQAEIKMWNLDTIDEEIIQGDIVILPYDLRSKQAKVKGANKLLKSWSLGMPTIVSPIEECRVISEESGIDCLAGEDLDEWQILLEWLEDEDLRKMWGQKGKAFSEKFKVEYIATRWKEVIQAEMVK